MRASTRLRSVELIRAPGVRAIARLAAAAAALIAAAVAAAVVMAAPPPAASGPPALEAPADASPAETLRACVAKLQRPARGLDALAAQCPDLMPALAALKVSETLSPGWESELTPGQLEDLAVLASRYRGEPPSAAPHVGAIRGILTSLAKEDASETKSWWEVVRDWVRSLLAGRDEHDLSWIERLMSKLSSAAGVVTVLTYVLVALVIGGALAYIVIETRSSGLFTFTRAARSGKTADGVRFAGDGPWEEELSRAPVFDQPALLIVLLVRCLKRAGRLSAERHLTHRELARAAALDDPGQRGRLGRLAQVAEELLYGARPPPVELVHRAIEEGRELLRQIKGHREMPP